MTTINHETYCGQDLITLLLKAGFDWQDYFVAHHIDEHFHWEIPLHIAQRWLREYTDGHVAAIPNCSSGSYFYQIQARIKASEDTGFYFTEVHSGGFIENYTYEEALEAGIKKALELILEKGEYGNN